MVTTAELQRRGLRYAVSVDAAATNASLLDLQRAGLPYAVEVADGATMASRAALEARGLRYLVPVAVGATAASKASLERQGLRYAVQVDADILPADRRELERQGLAYYVKVDSSGNSVATAAGGGLLLVDETNGFATDFTHAVDAERVALKTAGATTYSTVDGFYTQSGTSLKMVYDVAGVLGWSPHNLVTQSAAGRVGFEWAGNSSTRTGGQLDPEGGTQALQVITTGNPGLNVSSIVAGFIVGQPYTASMWCKGTLGQQIYFSAGGLAEYQVLVTFTGAWQRVSLSGNATATDQYIGFERYGRSAGGHLPDVTFTIWGGQFNRGTVPTSYLPTTTAARFGLALDYDPVTHAAKGLLCEPAATNLIIQSAAPATQGVTVTATAYTLSIFGTGTLTLTGTSTAGPLVGTGANNRVSLTFTPTAGTLTLTKSGTVTQAQLETGTVATSYIPTLAAQVTRAADVVRITPASINYSATAGSWWADVSLNAVINNSTVIGHQANGGDSPIYQNGSTDFALWDGTALSKGVGSNLGSHKVMVAFASADRALTADGLTPVTNATVGGALLSPGTSIGFGHSPVSAGTAWINGYIRKVRYLPRRPTNAELQTMTT